MKPDSTIYRGRRIAGEAGPGLVTVEGDGGPARALTPRLSQQLRNHSPDGFQWGYGGSGPAQLALALLLDFTGGDAELAQRHYQTFKWEYVANWPGDAWHIHGADVRGFLARAEIERDYILGRVDQEGGEG